MSSLLKIGGFLGLAFVGMGGTAMQPPEEGSSHTAVLLEKPRSSLNCDIKGNISVNSGEKIYHVRGQEYYNATRIRPYYGERWFCSEAEAQKAGWRRARR